ncbi:hypothetical protein M422DRAFT_270002 [Sphaerobolus stellatus SS14]|uniref:Uncharacterized protein n=1 Tax=Sphaerobolus stellatus (strain SS14) TaxID=990650 RepID=A0A0C9UU19_SPHS4|nr:hypothetical protein M422DRAFT_270002 [Sphaerobolus stellatus SS14]
MSFTMLAIISLMLNIWQNFRAKIAEKSNLTAKQTLSLDEARRKLVKALEAWQSSLGEFMPPEALQEELEGDRNPEKEKLRLPSDFDRSRHTDLGLETLADIEYRLRMGQANDALKKLREALGLKSFLVRKKYQGVGGQYALLRSETEIARAQVNVDKWAEVYRRAWNAMGRLVEEGPDGNHGRGRLQKLNKDDLVMLSQWMEDHRFWREKGEAEETAAANKGKGRKELPWIWKIEFDVEVTVDRVKEAVEKWTAEAIRVEWVHAKASMDRWDEELKLLEAESERIPRTFHYYERLWSKHCEEWRKECGATTDEGRGSRLVRGAVAFAQRTAVGFGRSSSLAETRYQELLRFKTINLPKRSK